MLEFFHTADLSWTLTFLVVPFPQSSKTTHLSLHKVQPLLLDAFPLYVQIGLETQVFSTVGPRLESAYAGLWSASHIQDSIGLFNNLRSCKNASFHSIYL